MTGVQPKSVDIAYSIDRRWTMEREQRHRARNLPNQEHVDHLRAGINEFRLLLENRSYVNN